MSELVVDFAGEVWRLEPDQSLTIGREGELVIDDNPFLHRRFLLLEHGQGLWWVANVGSRLPATLAERSGSSHSYLAPGARVPLVFSQMNLVFSAGATTYEILLDTSGPVYERPAMPEPAQLAADTTIGQVCLTPSQRLVIVALAEPRLRRAGSGATELPRNKDAAARLGWTVTRFNRKLDNVCDKLDRAGVKGLRGGPRSHASLRRMALVDYAVASRLVSAEDLVLLDGARHEEEMEES